MLSDAHAGVGFSKQVAPAVRALLSASRPDLVIFNGDTAGPGRIHVQNASQLRAVLGELTAPIEEACIPWAHTFGNRAETGFCCSAREEVACSEHNSGLFMACLERGDVKALFSGTTT